MQSLKAFAYPNQIADVIHFPERTARTTQWPTWVDPRITDALGRLGRGEPWAHQAVAATSIHERRHTVVATGTGSGKSLAAWVPVLHDLVADSARPTTLAKVSYRPTCLYLSPTKALAADQYVALEALASAIDPRIGIAPVDGDTEQSIRSWARDYADIVLTNPDFVNFVMLARPAMWARLWRGLSTIVVDEFHSYRGMFGAHVALLVRRIVRMAKHYGAEPTLVFLSATTGEPARTAARFLGVPDSDIAVIDDDASPAGEKDIVLWRCREVDDSLDDSTSDNTLPGVLRVSEAFAGDSEYEQDPWTVVPDTAAYAHAGNESTSAPLTDDSPRRAANTEAGELTGFLVAQGAHNLTFVRSRPGTERVAEIARSWLAEHAPRYEESVAAYRGGYLPEERRELENLLRSGRVRALATTNALELGIDISGLDSVVVTGWPGTHASFSQQIGRAGRAGKPGLAVFVGRDNPLDQYLLSHPDIISSSPSEANVFDPTNPTILIPHICAAASELPLTSSDAAVFELESTELFDALVSEGFLRKRPTGWFWNASLGSGAHDLVHLRGDATTVTIVDANDGTILGTVSAGQSDSSVYPGAIYVHQGVPYRVEELVDDVARVRINDGEDIRTYARSETTVEIERVIESRDLGGVTWARGDVAVSSRVIGYDVRRNSDGMFLGTVALTMPVRTLHTGAVWWTMPRSMALGTGLDQRELAGALHGAEHASIGMLPLFATCDRWDLGGLSTEAHDQTGMPTVFVHDAVDGGSGCAARGFEAALEWIEATYRTVLECPCSSGCPRCIQSPKCGNNNEPLSKFGASQLLGKLVALMKNA
ncbi:DEAD/DEAH box helicase [Arcanobacterium haemolyticum]|nr:DEAD/DEAH box helicase [Arcanobacterium haemolyticum]